MTETCKILIEVCLSFTLLLKPQQLTDTLIWTNLQDLLHLNLDAKGELKGHPLLGWSFNHALSLTPYPFWVARPRPLTSQQGFLHHPYTSLPTVRHFLEYLLGPHPFVRKQRRSSYVWNKQCTTKFSKQIKEVRLCRLWKRFFGQVWTYSPSLLGKLSA